MTLQDTLPPRVKIDGTINVATMVAIATLAIGGITYVNRLDARVEGDAVRLLAIENKVNERIAAAALREADQEARLRALETSFSRSDERIVNMAQAIARIERAVGAADQP